MIRRSKLGLVGGIVVFAVGAMGLTGCGDSDGGGGSTTGPTMTASQASISVSQNGRGTISISPTLAFLFRIRIPLRITESAGVAANINFARLSLRRNGVEIERQEIGSSDIIASVGDNRLDANGTETPELFFDFNSISFDTVILELGFTDDRGVSHNPSIALQANDFDFTQRAASFRAAAE